MRLRLTPKRLNLDFFKYGTLFFGLSVVLMLASAVSIGVKGFNYGIDFVGGTTIRTETTQPLDIGTYREALAPLGYGEVVITEVFDTNFRADQHVAMIRIQTENAENGMSAEEIGRAEAALTAVDPAVKFVSVETVGPKVSGELMRTAAIALSLSLLGVMIYVWLRFEWQFGVAGVAALVHDVLVTAGLFSIFGLKFDMTIVAALLTIVGYSINDTVVIFDRVREILVKHRSRPLRDIMNMALNETFSRTMMTSASVIVALAALYVFGGDVIRGFAFAMLGGSILGVYSTIFMASMVLIWLGKRSDWRTKKEPTAAGTQFPTAEK